MCPYLWIVISSPQYSGNDSDIVVVLTEIVISPVSLGVIVTPAPAFTTDERR